MVRLRRTAASVLGEIGRTCRVGGIGVSAVLGGHGEGRKGQRIRRIKLSSVAGLEGVKHREGMVCVRGPIVPRGDVHHVAVIAVEQLKVECMNSLRRSCPEVILGDVIAQQSATKDQTEV